MQLINYRKTIVYNRFQLCAIFKDKMKTEDVDKVTVTKRKISYNVNIAVDDKSTLFKDRLYLAYSIGPKDSLKTALKYSTDKGKSWSTPRILKAKYSILRQPRAYPAMEIIWWNRKGFSLLFA